MRPQADNYLGSHFWLCWNSVSLMVLDLARASQLIMIFMTVCRRYFILREFNFLLFCKSEETSNVSTCKYHVVPDVRGTQYLWIGFFKNVIETIFADQGLFRYHNYLHVIISYGILKFHGIHFSRFDDNP